MTTRPRSHVLETESKSAFEAILPSEWVIRDQVPDYGLDYQVQVFEEGAATPFYFFAQLKAVDKPIAKPSYSFETERLLYYVKQPFPVMLALYCKASNKMYYEWIHEVYKCLSDNEIRKWHLQKTIKIRLTNELLPNDQLLNEIKHQAYALGHPESSTEPFYISINIPYNKDLLINLQNKVAASKKTECIIINSGKQPEGSMTITNEETPLLVLHYKDENLPLLVNDINNPMILELTLLKGIALLLHRCGRFQNAADLIVALSFEKAFTVLPIALEIPYLSQIFTDSHRIADAIMISEIFFNACQIDYGLAFLAAALQEPDLYNEHYRRSLVSALSKAEGPEQKGTLHYNLANSLRSTGNQREAIKHFGMAARLYPDYKERSYWFAELAGSLFLDEKYKVAEKCYKKAYDMGEERLPVLPLLGDAILYQGRFKEAQGVFDEYLQKVKFPYAEYILKSWMISILIKLFGETVNRNSKDAFNLTEKAINVSEEQKEGLFRAAIQADPLFGNAWFNFAVYQSSYKQNKPYSECLVTAILQNWDIEAWANALILFDKNENNIELFSFTCYEGFRLHGTKLERQLFEVLKESMTNGEAKELINKYKMFNESVMSVFTFTEDVKPILRIHYE